MYSQKWKCTVSVPVSPFMCLWAIYIFPGSVHLFSCKQDRPDLSWEYIIRSQTHECGNWDWGRAIPFLGTFVSNFGQCASYILFSLVTFVSFLTGPLRGGCQKERQTFRTFLTHPPRSLRRWNTWTRPSSLSQGKYTVKKGFASQTGRHLPNSRE